MYEKKYGNLNFLENFFVRNIAFRLIGANLQERLVYRFDLIVGLIRSFITLLVFRYLWIALYGGKEIFDGISLNQTLTYSLMSLILRPVFQANSMIPEISRRIRSGNITFDIARPIYFGNLLFFQSIGRTIATFLFSSFPLFLLAIVFMDIQLPSSGMVWGAFVVSLILGYLTAFLIDYILSLFGFWVTNVSGFLFAKWNVIDLLGGVYIPLWFFPPSIKKIVLLLPFRGISYTPIAIFVNYVEINDIINEFSIQIMWVGVLFIISLLVYLALVKKLEIQGG
jgi:ABC-2 type transport system permease protein